ncbi:MAG TPA: TonB-dependent receptor, partial [Bryobacteraceae bacterium]|nr:TonB-dependent receptor [Bryobacteraceae bacterium]
ENNYRYTAQTNDVGYYTVGQLLEGIYSVRVEAPGFRVYLARDVRLAAQQLRRLDVKLDIGTVETTVEVNAGASLIETEKARISDTKGAELIKSLPLNTRSLWSFVGQNPGVVQAASATATRRFYGSRNNQSDAAVDGITISNGRDGTQISPLVNYIESFQEVKVDLANNTAEFGGLGQVTVISKSGTNDFHGAGFDYYQTPKFFSRNPFALTGSGSVQHQPGAAIGGPVMIPKIYNGKDRTFFFFSFETSRGAQLRQVINPTVPLASWREGDFSNLLPGTVVRDPFNGNTPFPGNRIPAARLNSVATKLQDLFYPLPNFGDPNVFSSQNYRDVLFRPFDPATYWTARLDHRFSSRDFIYGRFTWARQYSRNWDDNLPTIGRVENQRENQGVNVSYSHSFHPNLLNEFRWGVAYNDQPRNGAQNGLELVKMLGLQGLAPTLPDIEGIPQISFTGLGIQGLTQQVWRHPGFKNYVHQFQEQVSWFRGRHTLKAGFIINRVKYADGQVPNNLFGNLTFSNKYTGQPYADFLLGIPSTAARSFPNFVNTELRWGYDMFVTDEFKITRRLTLDLGMRYELHPSAHNVDGYNSLFDIGTGKIVVPNGMAGKVSALLPTNYVSVIEAGQAGLPQSLLFTDRNNFAPRLGLAWRPFGDRTVLRAGYGIYYDIVPETAQSVGVPFVIDQPTYTNPTVPVVILPQMFPATSSGPSTVSLPGARNTHIRTPYSMQYNVTLEHQQGNTAFRLSYVGTNTRKGTWAFNINQPQPGPGTFISKARAFPNYPAINYLTNGAGHQYNAMTAEVKRRGGHGLMYQMSYTLSRDIGDLERGQSPENAYDRTRERGPWLDIPTHNLTGNVVWEVPVGRGKRWMSSSSRVADIVLGNWAVSAIYTFHSGRFLTPLWTGPDPTGTAYTASATPAQVTIRPNILRDGNLPGSQQTTSRWFDVSAFTAPSPGSFGTAGPGVIIGPHQNVFDFGLFKVFPVVNERLLVRFEVTATNVLNHPNYNDPPMNITSAASVGVISGVGG